MSNTDRPRTNMKPCPFDKSTDRDSNGQCHCRNVLYRLSRVITDPETFEAASKSYNNALKKGKTIDEAREAAKKKAGIAKPAKKAAPAKSTSKSKSKSKGKAATKKSSTKKSLEEIVADEEAAAKVEQPEPEWDDDDLLGVGDGPADEVEVHEGPEHESLPDPDGGFVCRCGFKGKGTSPSIRSHVARENRAA
jgi:hypothetical protein